MREIDKLKAGSEYCYSDPDVYVLKENAIRNYDIEWEMRKRNPA